MNDYIVKDHHKAGDIIKESGETKGLFYKMNYGSIIKITKSGYGSMVDKNGNDPNYCLIMRCNQSLLETEGVCIGSDIPELIGTRWGSNLQAYTYEILLLK